MTANHEHTPNISDFREDFVTACVQSYWLSADRARDYFNRELAAVEAAAEQRGAIKALRDIEASLIDWGVLYGHEQGTAEDHESIRIAAWIGRRADQIEGDDE